MSRAEWIATLLFLLVAALLAVAGGMVPLLVAVGLWAGLLIATALVLRRAWQRWFGPVFFYDLVRTSRRGRYFVLRCGYAGALLLVLFVYYESWFSGLDLDSLFEPGVLRPADVARFADGFFTTFLLAQFITALVVTPLIAAGAITEEKEKRTFEYLLTTDLHNREIVLGKLGSRLAQTLLLVFAGLPVFSLLQFLGGVDPELVLAGFLATALTVASVASLGIAASVQSRTTSGALFRTYFTMLTYLFFSLILGCCTHAVSFLNFGNPLLAYLQLRAVLPGDSAQSLAGVLTGYCVSHVILALGYGLGAVRKLRGPALDVSRREPLAPLQLPPRDEDRPADLFEPVARRRLPVGDHALWWKETRHRAIYLRTISPRELLRFLGVFTLVGAVLLLFGVPLKGPLWEDKAAAFRNLAAALSLVFRFMATALSCLIFFLVAINAAGRVSRECEKQTLESLLTLPIERHEILKIKWLASILHFRGLWWPLGWLWLLGLLTGGPTYFGLPLLIAWWWVYAAFAAALGMWFSVVTRSTLRSTLWAPLAALAVPAGAWIMVQATIDLLTRKQAWLWAIPALEQFQDYGLAPPAALWALSAPYGNLDKQPGSGRFLAALAGMGFYLVVTALLYQATRQRFRALTNELAEGKQT